MNERAVAQAKLEVVPLLQQMLLFDTDAAGADAPPRREAEHQEFVAGYLRELGAEVEIFEPDRTLFADHPLALPNQTFEGRPILWARVRGRPGGRTLLFNGHYDTVLADPIDQWSFDPRGSDIVDGRLYGRGACDMKGGNAAAIAALAGLVKSGADLSGDVLINLVPFEEVNGMGTIATMLAGKRADAAICCEPTELRPMAACRGVMEFNLEVPGRAAHAEVVQKPHALGGGVNAINKAADLLAGIRRLHASWQTSADKQHPLLSPPSIEATVLHAGTFWASLPESASIGFDITYLPGDADEHGLGSLVRNEIESELNLVAAADDWLAEHPPQYRWESDLPPAEVDVSHPFVRLAVEVASHAEGLGGFDSWADHVSLVSVGGIPAILLGPGSLAQAHTSDEFVAVDDLHRCVEIYTEIIERWGTAPDAA
jgi:acetylornithine deacetylase